MEVIDILRGNGLRHPDHKFPDLIPAHEFTWLMVAPRGGGKTNLICNLLLRFLKGYFHKILVCSPSVKSDQKWDIVKKTTGLIRENRKLKKYGKLLKEPIGGGEVLVMDPTTESHAERKFDGKIPEDCFFEDLEECEIRMREQKEMIESLYEEFGSGNKFVADRVLLVVDDQAGKFKVHSYNNPMASFIMRHRHYGTSVICVTQAYKAITYAIRNNSVALSIFDVDNEEEKKLIYAENGCSMEYKEWEAIYQHCTRSPYSFMYINSTLPKGERIYRNLSKRIVYTEGQQTEEDGKGKTAQATVCAANGIKRAPANEIPHSRKRGKKK